MNIFLLYPDRDLDLVTDLSSDQKQLVQDLDLETVLAAMSSGDELIRQVATQSLLSGLTTVDDIRYRQQVLSDALAQPSVVRDLYDLAGRALDSERRADTWWLFRDSPEAVLARSVKVLDLLLDYLRQVRNVAQTRAAGFTSTGFRRLAATLSAELDDAYLHQIAGYLDELKLNHGVLMSAGLGGGLKATRFLMHRPPQPRWLDWVFNRDGQGYSFQIPDRDENGFRALREIRDCGINATANVVGQAADHVLGFFTELRTELAFYVGCLNLHDRLSANKRPTCLPDALSASDAALSGRELYDPALALRTDHVVGNDFDADGKTLVMITGANQGGKSTFLRSLGVAQLMMQAGMFTPSASFRASIAGGVFTHFRREEDATMSSGKLDEELARISVITDRLEPGAMLLCNESFASTNEQEGSEIARQVIQALTEAGVRVIFVTHLYTLAHGQYRRRRADALFLRAGRERTYRLTVAEPLPTSHGKDAYLKIFGTEPATSLVAR